MIIFTTIAQINWTGIFTIYGLINICFMPIAIIALVVIAKKQPTWLMRLNDTIDDILGIEYDEIEQEQDQEPVQTETEVQSHNDRIDREHNIHIIELNVGDEYRCSLTKWEIRNLGTNINWGTDNSFIGKIDKEKGIFVAQRAGTCYISCSEYAIYRMDVRSTDQEWYGNALLQDVINNTDIVNVKVRNTKRLVSVLDEDKRLMGWEETLTSPECLYGWNNENKVTKAICRFAHESVHTDYLKKTIEEYLEPIELKNEDGSKLVFWIHKSITDDNQEPEVDKVAIYLKSSSGEIYFGIANTWKDSSTDDEIKQNPDMIFRLFKGLIPDSDIPVKVKSRALEKKDKPDSEKPQPEVKENETENTKENEAKEDATSESKPEESDKHEDSSSENEEQSPEDKDKEEDDDDDDDNRNDNYEPHNYENEYEESYDEGQDGEDEPPVPVVNDETQDPMSIIERNDIPEI